MNKSKSASNRCPLCTHLIMPIPTLTAHSLLLIVDSPDIASEITRGIYCSGELGSTLRKELAYSGADWDNIHITYFWLHAQNEGCLAFFRQIANQLIKKAASTMIMGSQAVENLTSGTVADYSGCWIASQVPNKKVLIAPSLLSLKGGSIGEFRLALRRFLGKDTHLWHLAENLSQRELLSSASLSETASTNLFKPRRPSTACLKPSMPKLKKQSSTKIRKS